MSRGRLIGVGLVAVLVAAAVVAALLTHDRTQPTPPVTAPDETPPDEAPSEPLDPTLTWPAVTSDTAAELGDDRVAPAVPEGHGPDPDPVSLAGDDPAPLPPTQWWTPAAVNGLRDPIWAHPLAVRAEDEGLAISGAAPTASPDAIVTPFEPDLVAGGRIDTVEVTGYGAFSVDLRFRLADGGTLETVVVQGSPLLHLRASDHTPRFVPGAGAVVEVAGTSATIVVGGRTWDLVADEPLGWDGTALHLPEGRPDSLAVVALRPDDADGDWPALLEELVDDPIIGTDAHLTTGTTGDGLTVTQTLRVAREGDTGGPMALLPHHRRRLAHDLPPSLGSYRHARGHLEVVTADNITVEVPTADPAAGLPTIRLDDAARAAIVADLDADLADDHAEGGSYFGLKELGRLATIAEVADVVGLPTRRTAALERLAALLEEWLTYDGPDDGRYLAVDDSWGGVIAIPPEFGLEQYNDHHLQYGYLVRAAAVMAAADARFVATYGDTVDLVIASYAPRVFHPWLGHSAASGFVPFADGNNQESSSEAVAAWEAIARWGVAADRPELAELGRALYGIEAETARTYWLGEPDGLRPPGYDHTVAGIVWDAKIDFATWFSPDPEAIVGIQLLPLTAGSSYRADPDAARQRADELEALVGGEPRSWGDLFVADLAIADPDAARDRLDEDVPREPSTARAMVRYWVEVQATRRD